MRRRQGFTLLELLMVVVILGILGAVAIPQYMKTQEKARMSEAMNVLVAIRNSQARYYAERRALTGTGAYADALNKLDFDPSVASAMMGNPFFIYSVQNTATGLAIARRNASRVPDPVTAGCASNTYAVTLAVDGTWLGRDCQKTTVP